ncbi:MAG: helix-turn-helix domain-containing protein [Ilumatobacteraceae bacterium]|nr:helix-turn-helix domain-containing protein [Ilumatobacteraceae bacterium]
MTINELTGDRVAAMTAAERAAFRGTYEAARLALYVGERVRDAREAAGLSQRELAARSRTSKAAIARLEAGEVTATLAKLHKVALSLGLSVTVELSSAI